MTSQQMAWLTTSVLLWFQFGAIPAQGDDERRQLERAEPNADPNFDKDQCRRWIEFYRQEAASYRFQLGSDHTKELKLRESPIWSYAPVRFSHLTLTVHHGQQEVWRDARDSKLHRDPTMGYKLFYGVSVQSEVIESE